MIQFLALFGISVGHSCFRPISILTCFSKIFEKFLYKRLFEFFENKKFLNPHQYGFQRKLSTPHAILDIVTTFYDNINHNTGLLFLDLKKGFDSVFHKTLLSKAEEHYGIEIQLLR